MACSVHIRSLSCKSVGIKGSSDSVSRPCSVRVWRSGREWGRVTLSRDHAPCGSGGQGERGRVTLSRYHAPCGSGGQGERGRVTLSRDHAPCWSGGQRVRGERLCLTTTLRAGLAVRERGGE